MAPNLSAEFCFGLIKNANFKLGNGRIRNWNARRAKSCARDVTNNAPFSD